MFKVIQAIISTLAAVTGVIAFVWGLYQYYIAQKWKKSEFAAQQLEKLTTDPELELCCKCLDGSHRYLPIPEKYKALVKEDTFFYDKNTFYHDCEVLKEAMEPQRTLEDWRYILYRDIFDHFFDYLEQIDHYLSIKLIDVEDVSSLAYWLRKIAFPDFWDFQQDTFLMYVRAFDYSGVLALIKKFDQFQRRKERKKGGWSL